MKTKYVIAGITASILTFSSCSKKSDSDAKNDAQESSVVDSGVNKDDLAPNEAVEQWAKDMVGGQLLSLWSSLPATYQSDVEGLAHQFGAKVDSEVYNEAVKTLTSVSELLAGKKAIILEILNEQGKDLGEDKIKSISENYDLTVNLINTLVRSKIKDAEGLKSLNMQEFLSELQPQFTKLAEITRPFILEQEENKWLENPTVELISENGDSAEVKDPASAEGTPRKLTRVENRWVPADMAGGWGAEMAKAKEGIASMGTMEDMQKQQVLGLLRMIQSASKDLGAATTKEEFMQKSEKHGKMFGGMLMGQ